MTHHILSKTSQVLVPDRILAQLETFCATASGREISGVGMVRYAPPNIEIVEVWALAGGSEVFTQIQPEHLAELLEMGVDLSKVKLWWHRHPVGNGVPGPHNWSSTDENTCTKEPLGSTPDMVKWSVSIVRTPFGWVGRMDDYRKEVAFHLPVQQALSPNDHLAIHAMMPREVYGGSATGSSRGTANNTEPDWMRVRGADAKLVKQMQDQARQLPLLRSLFPKGRKAKKVRHMLRTAGVTEGDYAAIRNDLVSGSRPEVVAELYNVDLGLMCDVGIITKGEYNDARFRLKWWADHYAEMVSGEIAPDEVPQELQDRFYEEFGFA